MILAEFTDNFNDLQTERLYQWDVNQTLKISGISFGSIAVKVHFCNKKSESALVVESTVPSNGSVDALIPNSLLQEPYDIIAYVYQTNGATSNTIKTIRIPVIPRKKPKDYSEPSGDIIIETHEIELAAKAIIDGLTASEYNSTETYKLPNIVYYETSSYFCKSNTEITGIPPTNTEYWQKLCNGLNLSTVTLNAEGNLVFTFDDGTVKTVVIETIEGTTISVVDRATNAQHATNADRAYYSRYINNAALFVHEGVLYYGEEISVQVDEKSGNYIMIYSDTALSKGDLFWYSSEVSRYGAVDTVSAIPSETGTENYYSVMPSSDSELITEIGNTITVYLFKTLKLSASTDSSSGSAGSGVGGGGGSGI